MERVSKKRTSRVRGIVKKQEEEKVKVLFTWMNALNCMFLN